MKKRILVTAFIIMLFACVMAVSVNAAEFKLTYTVSGGKATITGYTGDIPASGDLVIPDTIDGYPVTAIGDNAFCYCYGFTGSLTIGSNVTAIGDNAFCYCYGFTGSLTIGSNVTTIGDSAFEDCSSLTGSLTIPDSVTTIGDYAFCYCYGFTGSLTIGNSVTTIGDYAFFSCNNFTGNLTIPESVTTIGYEAFYNCIGIDNIYFSGDAPEIGNWAFSGCSATLFYNPYRSDWPTDGKINGYSFEPLTECGKCGDSAYWMLENDGTLVISGTGSMNDYGYNEIYMATNAPWGKYYKTTAREISITGIVIANGITGIGNNAFFNLYEVEGNIDIPYSVTSIGERAFERCSGAAGLTLGQSVSTIGKRAFYNCSGMTGNLIIPDSVVSIGESAFGECGFTGTLKLGSSVEEIGSNAFSFCRHFTGSIIIPDSVLQIGYGAFMNCSGFNGSIVIGKNVTVVGGSAFNGCSKVGNVYFRGNAPAANYVGYYDSFVSTAVLHYIPGTTGWSDISNGRWKGYSITTYLPNDINGDGKENVSDAIYLMWSILGKTGYSLPGYALCDYDGNGTVNASDAVYLLWSMFYPSEYPLA